MHHIVMDLVMLTLAFVFGVVFAPVLVPWVFVRGREGKGTAGIIAIGIPGIGGWMIALHLLGHPPWLALVPIAITVICALVWNRVSPA